MPEQPHGGGTQHGVGPGSFEPPSTRVPTLAGSQGGFRGIGSPIGTPGLLQSFEGVVTSNQMLVQESSKATKEILAASDRTARMMGTIIERAGQMMGLSGHSLSMADAWAQSGAVGLTVGGAAYAGGGAVPSIAVPMNRSLPAAPPSVAPPAPPSGGAPPPSSVPPKPVGDRMTRGEGMRKPPTDVPEGRDPRTARGGPANWEEGLGYWGGGPGNYDPSGFSLSHLRQDVARGVNRRVSEWGIKYERTQDATGRWHDARGRFATAPDWKTKGVGMAKNVLGAMEEGEGLGGALASAAPMVGTALGVVGAGYAAVRMGEQFAVSQRAANMEYQSVLGGSNAEGFKERIGNFGFRMRNFGTMSGRDAHTIYMGALENYGTDSGMRNEYQDAAVDLYRNAGLSADEGTRLLNMAAGQGNDHLNAFANAIRDVGHAAREAGEGAQDARAFFEEAFNSTQGWASGTTQIAAAKGMANVRTSLGDQFSDANFSGMDSDINRRRMAMNLGMSYPEFIAKTMTGVPGGSTVVAQGRQSLVRQAIASIDPQGNLWNDAGQRFRQMAKDAGGIRSVTDGQINRLAGDLLANHNVDPTVLAGLIKAQTGIEVSEADAMPMFLRMAYGDVNFIKEDERRIKGLTETVRAGDGKEVVDQYGDKHDLRRRLTRSSGSSRMRPAIDKRAQKSHDEWNDYLRDQFGMKDGSSQGEFDTSFNEGSGKGFAANRSMSGRVRNSLLNTFKDKGFYSGIGRNFYEQLDDQFGDDARFVVKTKHGDRAVDAYRLVETYLDQLRADPNSIRVIGGERGADGKTVGEVLGTPTGEKGFKVKSDHAGGKTGGEYGEKVSEAQKEAGKNRKDSKGTVEIIADPWLKQFFSVRTGGSAYQAYSYGNTPGSAATSSAEDLYTTGTNTLGGG